MGHLLIERRCDKIYEGKEGRQHTIITRYGSQHMIAGKSELEYLMLENQSSISHMNAVGNLEENVVGRRLQAKLEWIMGAKCRGQSITSKVTMVKCRWQNVANKV